MFLHLSQSKRLTMNSCLKMKTSPSLCCFDGCLYTMIKHHGNKLGLTYGYKLDKNLTVYANELVMNEPNAHLRCASCDHTYGKRVKEFIVTIAAGDSLKYQSFVYLSISIY